MLRLASAPPVSSLELLGEPLPAEPDRRSIIEFLASCQVHVGIGGAAQNCTGQCTG